MPVVLLPLVRCSPLSLQKSQVSRVPILSSMDTCAGQVVDRALWTGGVSMSWARAKHTQARPASELGSDAGWAGRTAWGGARCEAEPQRPHLHVAVLGVLPVRPVHRQHALQQAAGRRRMDGAVGGSPASPQRTGTSTAPGRAGGRAGEQTHRRVQALQRAGAGAACHHLEEVLQ